MPLSSGARLGAYEITALIGAGGMGEVYRAKDTRLARDVAIKVLADGVIADPDRIARFEQEAHATAALSHPNIVALFDVGSHNGRPFIVSELLEGQSLRDTLRQGPLPVRKALAARLRPGPIFAIERQVALFKTGTGTANTDIEEYAPAPDGSKFLFREYVGEPRLRLSVVTNWMGLLH